MANMMLMTMNLLAMKLNMNKHELVMLNNKKLVLV